MKTLADIKRRAKPGARLQVIEQTRRPVLAGTIRTITGAHSARCYDWTSDERTGPDDDGERCTPWPKASETRIIDPDTFEYDLRASGARGHTIRLRFLPPESTSLEALHSDNPARHRDGASAYGVNWREEPSVAAMAGLAHPRDRRGDLR